MTSNTMDNETARKLFRSGYGHYTDKRYELAIKTLEPALNADYVPGDKIKILSLIWGTVGDSYFALEQFHKAIKAYRESLRHDPTSGCINSYAYLVAEYGYKQDALRAIEAIDRVKAEIQNTSIIWRPLGNLISMLLLPKSWFISTFKVPIIRRKLSRMINE